MHLPTVIFFPFLVFFCHVLIKVFSEKTFQEKYFREKKRKTLMRKSSEEKILRKKFEKTFLHPNRRKNWKKILHPTIQKRKRKKAPLPVPGGARSRRRGRVTGERAVTPHGELALGSPAPPTRAAQLWWLRSASPPPLPSPA